MQLSDKLFDDEKACANLITEYSNRATLKKINTQYPALDNCDISMI